MQTGCNLCTFQNVVLLYLDFQLLAQLFLDEVPCQFFQAGSEVLFNVFVILVLVVDLHDALEGGFGELQLADTLSQVCTQIQHQFVLAVNGELTFHLLLDISTELFFATYNTFAQNLVKQFLVDGACLVSGNFSNLETEVRLHFCSFLFADLQQRAQFNIVVLVCLCRVEYQYIIYLGTVELGLFFLVLHVVGQHYRTFHLNTAFQYVAFSVQLAQDTLYHVAFLALVNLIVLASALCIVLHLLVHHLVAYLNLVVVQRVLVADLCVKLGSQSYVENKSEVFLVHEINGFLLLLIGEGFAQNVDFLFTDVFIYFLTQDLVHLFSQNLCAETLLQERCGNHAGTESGQACFLTEIFQGGSYLAFVVCLFNLDSQQGIYLVYLFK